MKKAITFSLKSLSLKQGSIIIILLIILLIRTPLAAFSQVAPAPKIESPNSASLGVFGEVPVSKFTGTPDISVPIHTVSAGSIKVPIALRYHPSLVKPNSPPGWTGLGWNLQSYGTISRQRNGAYDELDELYLNAFIPSPNTDEGLSGSEQLIKNDWNTPGSLKDYFKDVPVGEKALDIRADEFNFNVLGYSGKFFYTADGWKVISGDPIKVEPTGFLTGSEISNAIDSYTDVSIDLFTQHPRMFKGFTLTTPDGTKYIFGGIDAVELTSLYGSNMDHHYMVNTWFLKKIIDINQNEVIFDYERSYPICHLSSFTQYASISCEGKDGKWFMDPDHLFTDHENWEEGLVDTRWHGGNFIWSMYLKQISTVKETVSFEKSVSTQLRYTDTYLKYPYGEAEGEQNGFPNNGVEFGLHEIGGAWYVDKLKWEQLDRVIVKNKNEEELVSFQFKYSESPDQRLTLNSLYWFDEAGKRISYRFAYDSIEALPPYGGNYTDHWGFFNNQNLRGTSFNNLFDKRNTNPDFVKKGLIKTITYPTGGFTEFDWEAHKFSEVVAASRESLEPYLDYAGGCRIKEIRSYPENATLPVVKKFHYVKDFRSGIDVNTLLSSGVLNGLPQYFFPVEQRAGTYSGLPIEYGLKSFNSQVNYSYNGQGSYIGYSEVIEENSQGAYTKHTFTNYGPDIHNQSHFDMGTEGILGWKEGEDRYIAMSSLEQERGKPTGVFLFTNDNIPVEETKYFYRTDYERFYEYIKRVDFRGKYRCTYDDKLVLASSFKEFTYNYYVVKKETKQFDQTGANPVTTVWDYSYNDLNLLKEEKMTDSEGIEWTKKFLYPSDFTRKADADWHINKMQDNHLLNYMVEEQTRKGFNIVSAVFNHHQFTSPTVTTAANYPVRQQSYRAEFEVPLTSGQFKGLDADGALTAGTHYKLLFTADFDGKGKPLSVEKNDGTTDSYLWGLYNSLPVAVGAHAPLGTIAFTGFEDGEDENSGWTLAGTHYAETAERKTGLLSRKLSAGASLTKNMSAHPTPYTVSFWAKAVSSTASVTVNSGTGMAVSSGWSFFQQDVSLPAGGDVNIVISGAQVYLDEVRVHPKEASMRTASYNLSGSLNTITDENGVPAYYNHDTLQRLKLIQDQDKNVVKTYEYHYQVP